MTEAEFQHESKIIEKAQEIKNLIRYVDELIEGCNKNWAITINLTFVGKEEFIKFLRERKMQFNKEFENL